MNIVEKTNSSVEVLITASTIAKNVMADMIVKMVKMNRTVIEVGIIIHFLLLFVVVVVVIIIIILLLLLLLKTAFGLRLCSYIHFQSNAPLGKA